MSNAFYSEGKQRIIDSTIDLVSGTIKAILLDGTYTFSAGQTGLAAISGHRVTGSTDQSLTTKAVSSVGTYSADSVSFTGVSSSLTVKAVAIYADLGGGTTYLIAYFDTGTGFPLTTTGATITVDWNATPTNGTVFTTVG